RRLVGLLVRQRIVSRAGHPAHLRHGASSDMRKENDVVLGSKAPLAQFLVREVRVRNAVRIESGAPPAFVLGPGPAVDVPDAREIELVRLDGGRSGDGPGRQTQVAKHRLERRAIAVRNDDGSGAKPSSLDLEIFLGG